MGPRGEVSTPSPFWLKAGGFLQLCFSRPPTPKGRSPGFGFGDTERATSSFLRKTLSTGPGPGPGPGSLPGPGPGSGPWARPGLGPSRSRPGRCRAQDPGPFRRAARRCRFGSALFLGYFWSTVIVACLAGMRAHPRPPPRGLRGSRAARCHFWHWVATVRRRKRRLTRLERRIDRDGLTSESREKRARYRFSLHFARRERISAEQHAYQHRFTPAGDRIWPIPPSPRLSPRSRTPTSDHLSPSAPPTPTPVLHSAPSTPPPAPE